VEYDLDFVPQTVEDAVNFILKNLGYQDYRDIKRTTSTDAHHHGGRHFRNQWKLWDKKQPIIQDAIKTYGIAHADDVSGLIWAWVYARVKEENFDPQKHCEFYKEHWSAMGTTALKAGGVE
jgi:hypothetical protein